MSVVSPWGFGVNRAEIQQLVRELVILATGLDPSTIYVTDTAARGPMPARSRVSIQLGSPIMVKRTGNDERDWPTMERWLVTVLSVAGNPQRLTVLGTDYDYTAAGGDTEEDVRDGLIASIGTPVGFTATGVDTTQIQLDSTVDGQRLMPQIGPGNDISLQLVRSNAMIRNLRRFELQCNIRCAGLMDIEAPDTTQSGQSLADLIDMAISSRDMTEKMRDCGHVPVRISRTFTQSPFDDQQVSEGALQVVIATTARLDVGIPTVTQAPMQPNATQ